MKELNALFYIGTLFSTHFLAFEFELIASSMKETQTKKNLFFYISNSPVSVEYMQLCVKSYDVMI